MHPSSQRDNCFFNISHSLQKCRELFFYVIFVIVYIESAERGVYMEDILELVLTIVLTPFEGPYNNLKYKIEKIDNKLLRFLLLFLVVVIPLILLLGLYLVVNRIFRGYWI